MRPLIAALALLLFSLGIVISVEPGYAPGRSPGQAGLLLPSSPPAVSAYGGLYFNALIDAKGDGGVMYLRCFAMDIYRNGVWQTSASLTQYGEGVVTVGRGPFYRGGELNLTSPLMGSCIPVAMPSVDGLRLGSIRVVAPGARLAASPEGLYVSYAGGSISHVVSYIGSTPSVKTGDYLEVPPGLRQVVGPLSANITAGCGDVLCKADRIKRFLLANYQYMGTLDAAWPLIPPGEDPVLWFLTEGRKGVCIHFASAFVFLARSAGIPARLVVGYVSDGPVPAQWGKISFSPHAWAEVYIEGVGWVGVEATPGAIPQGPSPQLPQPSPTFSPTPLPPPASPPVELPQGTSALALFIAAGLAIAASLLGLFRRYVSLGVGEALHVRGPPGFSVYVNKRRVGRAPTSIIFDKPGVYFVRAGPLLYIVRVVDYRAAAGALFLKLLRKLRLPPTVTPRELAVMYPKYARFAELFERIRFGPLATRDDVDRLKREL